MAANAITTITRIKTIGRLSFDFRGRISCGMWWLSKMTVLVFLLLTSFLFRLFPDESRVGFVGAIVELIAGLWLLVFLWVTSVLSIKRFHDRGKSGWCLLFALIPIIGGIWCFFQLAVLPGDSGENKYGPAPNEKL